MTNKKATQCMIVYQFLKDNCVGNENVMQAEKICESILSNEKLSKYFDKFTERNLRSCISSLRRNNVNDKFITRRIGSNVHGYWLELENEDGIEYLKKLAKSTLISAINSGVPKEYFYQLFYRSVLRTIEERRRSLDKAGSNKANQQRISFRYYRKTIF